MSAASLTVTLPGLKLSIILKVMNNEGNVSPLFNSNKNDVKAFCSCELIFKSNYKKHILSYL